MDYAYRIFMFGVRCRNEESIFLIRRAILGLVFAHAPLKMRKN